MRIRLCIERPGDLPAVKIWWATEGFRLTGTQGAQGIGSSGPRVADLLRQVDEVVPLRLGGSWGLEDYVVEAGGFEALHFSSLAQVLAEQELVTIRPKSLEDVRARKLGGRDQISAAGVRLYDGVPWDRPFVRATARPAIMPNSESPRSSAEVEDEAAQLGEDSSMPPVRKGDEDQDESWGPVGGGGMLEALNASRSRGGTTIGTRLVNRTDGRRVIKPALRASPMASAKSVRFARDVVEVEPEAEPVEGDDDEDEEDDGDFDPEDFSSSSSGDESASDDQPAGDSVDSFAQLSQRLEDARPKHMSDPGADLTSSSGSDSTSESDPQSPSSSSSSSGSGSDSSSSSEHMDATVTPSAFLAYTPPPKTGAVQPAKATANTPPGAGMSKTKKRNERRALSSKLRKLKDLGLLHEDADIADCQAFFKQRSHEVAEAEIARAFEQRRKDLLEFIERGGVDISAKQPSAENDTPVEMQGIATSATARTSQSQDKGHAQASTGADADADDSWQEKITMTAVECSYDRAPYSTPPFPFMQRWHQQGRGKAGKKRKRGEDAETNIELDYGSEGVDVANSGNPVETPAEDTLKGASALDGGGDLPVLPDISTLPPLEAGLVVTGAIIAFREMEMSEATSWNPQISDHKTARITSVASDGTMELLLAVRDQKRPQKNYDPQTGERVYSRFEAPDLSDDEDEDAADASRSFRLDDLIEPVLVVPAVTKTSALQEADAPAADRVPAVAVSSTIGIEGNDRGKKRRTRVQGLTETISLLSPSREVSHITIPSQESSDVQVLSKDPTVEPRSSPPFARIDSSSVEVSMIEHAPSTGGWEGFPSDPSQPSWEAPESDDEAPQLLSSQPHESSPSLTREDYLPVKQDPNDDSLYDATPIPDVRASGQAELPGASAIDGGVTMQQDQSMGSDASLDALQGATLYLNDEDDDSQPLLQELPESHGATNRLPIDSDLSDDSIGLPTIGALLSQQVRKKASAGAAKENPARSGARARISSSSRRKASSKSPKRNSSRKGDSMDPASPSLFINSDTENQPARQNTRSLRSSSKRASGDTVDLTQLSDGSTSDDTDLEDEASLPNGPGWVQKKQGGGKTNDSIVLES